MPALVPHRSTDTAALELASAAHFRQLQASICRGSRRPRPLAGDRTRPAGWLRRRPNWRFPCSEARRARPGRDLPCGGRAPGKHGRRCFRPIWRCRGPSRQQDGPSRQMQINLERVGSDWQRGYKSRGSLSLETLIDGETTNSTSDSAGPKGKRPWGRLPDPNTIRGVRASSPCGPNVRNYSSRS
jgi:hypothetical protein